MANLSTFFGDAVASGTSSEITDPSKLPFIADNGVAYMPYGAYAQYHHGQNEFWNETDYNNSGGNIIRVINDNWVQQNADDQAWYTVTDISSVSGYWLWAKGFGSFGTADWATDPVISSLRITIDGTAYTRSAQLIHTNCNPATVLSHQYPFWGWEKTRASQTGTYRERYYIGDGPAEYYDYATHRSEEMSNKIGGTSPSGYGTSGVYYKTTPATYLTGYKSATTYGMIPKVRFENSLKVEAKITRATAAIAAGTYFGGPNGHTLNQHYYSNRAFSFHYLDIPTEI